MNFDKVKELIGNDILFWCERLLPDGKQSGREFKALNPTRSDGEIGSFSINLDTGVWADFACGDSGGDIISLYAYITGMKQNEAAQEIAKFYGSTLDGIKKPRKSQLIPMDRPLKEPDFSYGKLGKPDEIHKYKYGYVLRYDKNEIRSKKIFIPLNYGRFEGKVGWHFQQLLDNRPIYGLEKIKQSTKAIIIVEGERKCDTLQSVLAGNVVVSFAGGAQAWNKTDWNPVSGKDVILWPDNDEAGIKCMTGLAAKLKLIGCKIKIVDASQFKEKEDAHDICAKMCKQDIIDILRGAEPYPKSFNDDDDIIIGGKVYKNEITEIPTGWTDEELETKESKIEMDFNADGVLKITTTQEKKKKAPPRIVDYDANDVPYRVLGYGQGVYYFYSNRRSMTVPISSGSMVEKSFRDLMPDSAWWAKRGVTPSGKPDWGLIAEQLIKECEEKGMFLPESIRGKGAWMDRGKFIMNLGNYMLVDGRKIRPADYRSKYHYEASPGRPIDTDYEMNDIEAMSVYGIFRALRWDRHVYAAYMAGWCAIAPIAGALRWRPHIWITAPAGAGKSYLMDDILSRLLANCSTSLAGNSTESGIRRKMNGTSLPVIYDESEGETKSRNMGLQNILGLIRQSSKANSVITMTNMRTGQSEDFSIRSCFCLSSISPNIKQTADRTRFSVLTLRKDVSYNAKKYFKENIQKPVETILTEENCDAFLMRSINNIESILHNIDMLRDAMDEKGVDARTQDQYSALLAGAYLYKSTGKMTEQDAKDFLVDFDLKMYETKQEDGDEAGLMMFLLSHKVSVKDPGAYTREVWWLIDYVREGVSHPDCLSIKEAERALIGLGMKVEQDYLFIQANNPKLEKELYVNPQWMGWSHILLRMEGVSVAEKQKRIGGYVGRAIQIPMKYFKDGFNIYKGEEFHSNIPEDSELKDVNVENF